MDKGGDGSGQGMCRVVREDFSAEAIVDLNSSFECRENQPGELP